MKLSKETLDKGTPVVRIEITDVGLNQWLIRSEREGQKLSDFVLDAGGTAEFTATYFVRLPNGGELPPVSHTVHVLTDQALQYERDFGRLADSWLKWTRRATFSLPAWRFHRRLLRLRTRLLK